ncbi:E3 ubiquitin-protein ligase MIB2-like [Physella acuta]|uniref:E3 ubiquitin-protein ligase MIB2-like n=1 Tax=Physella acuta TaxID=109671 RepID=UPI0027DB7338|nr:E3 ubiquitin-protein ligase MIB2-like [Physella acuta]
MCTECCDFDLCTECYMADKHDLTHEFLRIDGPTLKRVLVPKRCDSQDNKVEVKGMFLGAKVVRGQDWKWGDQDGESGKQGQVVERRHYATDSYRSAVKVLWTAGPDSICRVGHNGKVDLKCVKPTSGGCYYKSHLQVLGKKTEPYFKKGDKVKCFRNLENLLRLQDKRFKWMDSAAKVRSV